MIADQNEEGDLAGIIIYNHRLKYLKLENDNSWNEQATWRSWSLLRLSNYLIHVKDTVPWG